MESEKGNAGQAAEREDRPVIVRNRDIPLLSGINRVMQDIVTLERRRDWQRGRMYNITQHLSGMPRGGGLPHGLEDAFALLSEIDEEHEARCRDYVRQLRRAQKILNGIGSATMRTFVVMKYVWDIPDTEIRAELNLTRRGFDRARRAVEEAECMAAVVWHEKYIVAQEILNS